ncbi:MAG: hypothetical protein A2W61_05040 [Deltaproteobacteria bacterium RIFCSPLOWO2_01_44_7]|nr:MAG: hypothetical protein A2712_09220 [Deltaproteobacteria bacterium RIFCSPHIGHO2_01_FULL_43_49]OGQ14463.1 MAG: hypothetical protein A3D22_09645 [Deltaproteobacteria bacterium RIFCSPHIGHO2_02_FULL_44_53]OGQ27844.1 MAG: hypothetical protein A3D98_04045 [Deltaproteobacteria bacterium RIFCSPHIGHO2_12_FULL_44_21]OGQ30920.1 MAG: hypothetical protein A2979_01720 [Deltaproteobacteria bacterium RIFCSPLOWO2_01_FULL_45_74]OGQ41147.1 MAG: hypothetical protein A2W61_05040 [Deltaproteobacteria bacterium 
MPNITVFDPKEHHIRLVGSMKTADSIDYEFRAILDTGAPWSEFSDQFLLAVGMFNSQNPPPAVRPSLQTQKYDKLVLPQVKICGHVIPKMLVYISHFENHWGVDALIGLDFFRRFRVTVDYKPGHLLTDPL